MHISALSWLLLLLLLLLLLPLLLVKLVLILARGIEKVAWSPPRFSEPWFRQDDGCRIGQTQAYRLPSRAQCRCSLKEDEEAEKAKEKEQKNGCVVR